MFAPLAYHQDVCDDCGVAACSRSPGWSGADLVPGAGADPAGECQPGEPRSGGRLPAVPGSRRCGMPRAVTAAATVLIPGTLLASSRDSAREFIAGLDEGDLLYMRPTLPVSRRTLARFAVAATDRTDQTVPEVELRLGKAGRAEAPPILRPIRRWSRRRVSCSMAAQRPVARRHERPKIASRRTRRAW